MVIPAAAIQNGSQGTFVYVVKQDQTVEVRPVTVGVTEGNIASIDNGLAAGEKVVTDGQDRLQAGVDGGRAHGCPTGACGRRKRRRSSS